MCISDLIVEFPNSVFFMLQLHKRIEENGGLIFITHSLHIYAHKSQLDLHLQLHSMTNSTNCCELPLDAYWAAC